MDGMRRYTDRDIEQKPRGLCHRVTSSESEWSMIPRSPPFTNACDAVSHDHRVVPVAVVVINTNFQGGRQVLDATYMPSIYVAAARLRYATDLRLKPRFALSPGVMQPPTYGYHQHRINVGRTDTGVSTPCPNSVAKGHIG